jgi:hypothetical protein
MAHPAMMEILAPKTINALMAYARARRSQTALPVTMVIPAQPMTA